MDASELRARARQEADELGPEPAGTQAETRTRLPDASEGGFEPG